MIYFIKYAVYLINMESNWRSINAYVSKFKAKQITISDELR
jgi:hypothetical protein